MMGNTNSRLGKRAKRRKTGENRLEMVRDETKKLVKGIKVEGAVLC